MSANGTTRDSTWIGVRMLIILGCLSLLSLGVYLLASQLTYRVGFPLDDAWIHQTYARNLARYGEWAFIPGQISGGSTSPLWSVILAAGYLLKLAPFGWTFLWGWICLTGLAAVAEGTARKLVPEYRTPFPWVGMGFLLEWHLVWSAGSGMETLLYAGLISLVLFSLLAKTESWRYLGLLVGLAVWVRPDGVTLLGPVLLGLAMRKPSIPAGLKQLGWFAGGFLLFFAPYLAFNRLIAGAWWPNTFYAKQAEYASLQQIPLMQRFGNELLLPLVGAGVLLLPGALYFIWNRLHHSPGTVIPVVLWYLGYVGLYAWRLPVIYQHGRYIQPAMPVFYLLGWVGALQALYIFNGRFGWAAKRVWVGALASVLLVFWVLGIHTYSQDVAIIESEMVDTARWVAANTSPNSLIAAHDIGALGYFGDRKIVDLAGLISPDVIHFIRDESQLKAYLDQRNVRFLMTFPDWYPNLVSGVPVVYRSSGRFAPAEGQPNMCVYQWGGP